MPHLWTISGLAFLSYREGMFENFNPVHELPLSVVTDRLIIDGTLRTRLGRLTDVVNEPDLENLALFGAVFMEIGSRRVIARADVSQVQLGDVLFLHTTASTESTGQMRMPKQPVKTLLLAPPFTIEGQIYLPYEESLNQALGSLSGRFIPITDASYWAYAVAESHVAADLLVVNRARAHIAVPPGTPWESVAPPEPGSSGSDGKPW
jgi:hypothetical protein